MAATEEQMKKQLDEQQSAAQAASPAGPAGPGEPLKVPEGGGIVGSQVPEPRAEGTGGPGTDSSYTAGRTTPVTGDVKDENTVESRLNALTSGDSKYIKLAQEDAMRNANSRGLINSSMAAAAGTDAAIRNALPIAEKDAASAEARDTLNQNTNNEFLKNEQSIELNKEMADFESSIETDQMKLDNELKKDFESFMNDEKYSDEIKLQYVSTMNNIMRDSNQQITDIGTSDRSAAQQATAIDMILKNRDAEIKVYQDLLEGFDDWEWGTNFTPESTTTIGQDNNYWNAPGGEKPLSEPKMGDRVGRKYYSGNGTWSDEPIDPKTGQPYEYNNDY